MFLFLEELVPGCKDEGLVVPTVVAVDAVAVAVSLGLNLMVPTHLCQCTRTRIIAFCCSLLVICYMIPYHFLNVAKILLV